MSAPRCWEIQRRMRRSVLRRPDGTAGCLRS